MGEKKWKLLIAKYPVLLEGPPTQDEKGNYVRPQQVTVPYDVVSSISNIMLDGKTQQLNGRELLNRHILGQRMIEAERENKEFILISSDEKVMLENAFNGFHGLGKNEVEMVRRIFQAEEVEG